MKWLKIKQLSLPAKLKHSHTHSKSTQRPKANGTPPRPLISIIHVLHVHPCPSPPFRLSTHLNGWQQGLLKKLRCRWRFRINGIAKPRTRQTTKKTRKTKINRITPTPTCLPGSSLFLLERRLLRTTRTGYGQSGYELPTIVALWLNQSRPAFRS